MSPLSEIRSTIESAVEHQGPAVVGVGRGWRVGSGVVTARDRVLTAAHNVAGDRVTVGFADGRSGAGSLVAADRELGVAVLETDTGDVKPLDWTDEGRSVAIGTPVLALANPGGRGLRVTLGFVSAAERSFRGPRGRRITSAIEHTAALPRGSSGGPLLDLDGRLLGLNALRLEGGLILALGAGAGLREVVERLARGEEPERPFLGVAVAPPAVARRMRRAVGLPEREGLLVRAVEDGTPAARAGVEQGDLIVAASGRSVDGIDALHRALDEAKDGGLAVTVVRGTEERELEVELSGRRA